MKKNNHFIIAIILSILPVFCFSQNHNWTVFYNSESFAILNKYWNSSPFSQYGLGIQKKISPKFLIRLTVSQWANKIFVEEHRTTKNDLALSYAPFHLTGRESYGFYDICLGYYLSKKKYELSFIGGVTYAKGYDQYTKIIWNGGWYNGQYYIFDGVGYSKQVEFTSWGINSKICYDRYYYHNRINLGFQAGARYLFEYTKPQFELGFHAGYNFNIRIFKKKSLLNH
jgi:hypothetical protein